MAAAAQPASSSHPPPQEYQSQRFSRGRGISFSLRRFRFRPLKVCYDYYFRLTFSINTLNLESERRLSSSGDTFSVSIPYSRRSKDASKKLNA